MKTCRWVKERNYWRLRPRSHPNQEPIIRFSSESLWTSTKLQETGTKECASMSASSVRCVGTSGTVHKLLVSTCSIRRVRRLTRQVSVLTQTSETDSDSSLYTQRTTRLTHRFPPAGSPLSNYSVVTLWSVRTPHQMWPYQWRRVWNTITHSWRLASMLRTLCFTHCLGWGRSRLCPVWDSMSDCVVIHSKLPFFWRRRSANPEQIKGPKTSGKALANIFYQFLHFFKEFLNF